MKQSEILEKTYRTEKKHLLNWLIPRVGIDEAEDILHDIFLRTAINLDTSEGISNLQAWIWQSARNILVDRWRKRNRTTFFPHEPNGEDSIDRIIDDMRISAENKLEQTELLTALRNAIQSLPSGQREVIVAQSLNGETFAKISERTGISINTLAARKRYALTAIRHYLTENFFEKSGGTL